MSVTHVVWCPDRGQSFGTGRKVLARDAQTAAEKWAKQDDYESTDFSIADGNSVTLHVCDLGAVRPIEIFEVFGEAVPTYYARKIND
jgi:hypothetical protein